MFFSSSPQMKLILVALLVIVALAETAPNFHRRRLYYNHKEHVCQYGTGFDQVELFIKVKGVLARQVVVKSGLFCRVWAWTDV